MSTTPFNPTALPTPDQLTKASALPVQDQHGTKHTFSSLISPAGSKTIVLFIRHFGCGLCQDMVSFISHKLPPATLADHAVKLIIVGNGSPGLIGPYKELLDCPYEIYTDPGKVVYSALGMTLRTFDAGKFDTPPEYLRGGMVTNVLSSIGNIFKMGKLFTTSTGDLKALGGEFVFDGPENVTWCHRMENTRGHATVAEIATAAGVPVPA